MRCFDIETEYRTTNHALSTGVGRPVVLKVIAFDGGYGIESRLTGGRVVTYFEVARPSWQ